jgi:hypothetical protein
LNRQRQSKAESPNCEDRRALAPEARQTATLASQPLVPGENLDKVVVRSPECCEGYGRGLSAATVEVLQIFDLPEPTMTNTEHRAKQRRCQGGTVTRPACL